ncbi:MAG: type II toxin-antitoxin system HicA family toxin [Phycisphaeraceae bacterium]|nr:type II toxin-antitoxin system HicA family toxin [Phycisphaeraceae bacterium]
MSGLPVMSGLEVIGALARFGFQHRRTKGSHAILVRESPRLAVTVPLHRELDRGTLRAIIRQSGLSVETFVASLNR